MFGSKKEKKSIHGTTIITDCVEMKGNVKGCCAVHIDGTVYGDVEIEESVVIGQKGTVHGNVKSKKVIVSGMLNGSIVCDELELMAKGEVSDKIEAKIIISDGIMNADISAEESIHILQNANVNSEQMKSKKITVEGSVKGNIIATQLLEIGKTGLVEGNMTVKNIKTEEGGRMLGAMSSYMEVTKKPKPKNDNDLFKEEVKNVKEVLK